MTYQPINQTWSQAEQRPAAGFLASLGLKLRVLALRAAATVGGILVIGAGLATGNPIFIGAAMAGACSMSYAAMRVAEDTFGTEAVDYFEIRNNRTWWRYMDMARQLRAAGMTPG